MKKYIMLLIPVVLLATITIILFPYRSSKPPLHEKKADPKTEMVKKIAKMIKDQPRVKRQESVPVKPAPVIEEKMIEPQDRVMATSLREEIKRYVEEGKENIRIVLNTTDDKEEVSNSVLNAGGKVIRKRPGFMAVEVPSDKAEQLIMGNNSIGYARLPFKFFPTVKVTEGVELTGANIFHDTIYRGAGVKVAVLDGGFKGLTAAISAGELPANVITHDFTTQGLQTESRHGTACAEIIHDMAPDAELHLLKMGDELDTYDAIDYCIENHIDIVNLSMGTFGTGPGDGTGPLDEAFDELRNAGILVVAATGNFGNMTYEEDGTSLTIGSHWEGTFNDNNNDTWHEFKPGDSNSYYNVLFAAPDTDDDGKPRTSEVSILLRWDSWPVTNIDYNLELYTYNYSTQTIGSTPVKSSSTLHNRTQPPVEYISLNVPDSATEGVFYAIKVKRRTSGIPTGTKMEIYLGGTSQFVPFRQANGTLNNPALATSTSSISEPADALSVMAVGAINYTKWQIGPQEQYSSQGPTNNWNGSTARTKPDIMGPDGVTTFTYGDASFSGTSAAAPHVAGVAALNLSMKPDITPNELQEFLEKNAIDMGTTRKDNIYGAGRINAVIDFPIVKSFQKISASTGNFTGNVIRNSQFGRAIVTVGDLNGDAVKDFVVGDPYDRDGGYNSGAVWVLFMNSNGTVKSHQKISGTEGNFAGTIDNYDNFGSSITSPGDLNGDGTIDLIVGAFGDDVGGVDKGAVWVLFMNSNGTVKSHQKISSTEGNFTGILDNQDIFGCSITSPGDFNRDGIMDLAVGAYGDDDGGSDSGAIWILFMNTDGTVKSQQKISRTEGNFTGTIYSDHNFGSSITSPGDLNGDGIIDLIVGAFFDGDGGHNKGAAWVLFMNSNGTVKSHQKISSTEGSFAGILDDNDYFGSSITSPGDLNGDGINDLAVGAYDDDDSGVDKGAVWVLFMNSNGTVKSHQKISSTEGNFTGILDNNDYFGSSITSPGDLNGDGINDLAVGAYGDDDGGSDKGAVWILFLNPFPYDKDHDNMLDSWETKYGLNTNLNDASADADNDGLANINEYKTGTHPKDSDTDADGITDGNEDKNHNGVLDSGETNPADADTDNDGMPDGWEVQYGLNPLVNDANGDLDNDRFSNIKEYQKGTLPNDRRSRPKTSMPWLPLLLEE